MLVRRKGFHIFTDHRNLEYIMDPGSRETALSKPTADRLERWAVSLRSFQYTIQHLAGERNVWADLLTRWGAPVQHSPTGHTALRS